MPTWYPFDCSLVLIASVLAGASGWHRLAPSPVDARWDPSTLLAEGADKEPRWSDLQIAARDGDIERVTEILSRYEDDSQKLEIVNQPAIGYYGQTALQAACTYAHEAVVRALLEAGANINAPGGNNMYRNAFELACGTGGSCNQTITSTRITDAAL
jgi:ankyrin repeat protein